MKYIKPDIILLDVIMPGIDGFETCRQLKRDPQTQGIPIIFMTALSETVNKIKGFELGAVDYITKPFQQEEVLARINTHLTIRNLQKELQIKNERLTQLQACYIPVIVKSVLSQEESILLGKKTIIFHLWH